jgi:hypothetical protein
LNNLALAQYLRKAHSMNRIVTGDLNLYFWEVILFLIVQMDQTQQLSIAYNFFLPRPESKQPGQALPHRGRPSRCIKYSSSNDPDHFSRRAVKEQMIFSLQLITKWWPIRITRPIPFFFHGIPC